MNKSHAPQGEVPVVIVGNINVGGTGKSPFVQYLVKLLEKQNLNVGIIARGYKSQAPSYPYLVLKDSPVEHAGDEALMNAQKLNVPIMIDANRSCAYQAICQQFELDVVISDDGLQHHKLWRDLSIVLVDGEFGFGNGQLIPAGPLRQSISTLNNYKWLFNKGEAQHKSIPSRSNTFHLTLGELKNYKNQVVDQLPFNQTVAVTAIGQPESFFNSLKTMVSDFECKSFIDHYQFQEADFDGFASSNIVMTEKDWVKCKSFIKPNMYYLSVNVEVESCVEKALLGDINNCIKRRKKRLL